jgi:hypothetical protein
MNDNNNLGIVNMYLFYSMNKITVYLANVLSTSSYAIYKRLTSLKISSNAPSPIRRRSSFLPSSSPALSAASTLCLLLSLRKGMPLGIVQVGDELK